MRAKTLLTVLFVLSIGVAVVVVMRAMPRAAPNGAAPARDEILVATTALAAGTLLRPEDVAWQRAKGPTQPGQILRPNAVARGIKPDADEAARAPVYGAALRAALAANEPVRRGDIVKPGDRDFLDIVLSPGTRAMAIPVHMAGPTGPDTRFLGPFPGDRVDIILTQKFLQDLPLTHRSVGEAVLENLRVLAIAPPDAKTAVNNTGEVTVPMTLEVTPEQAEKITVATELGKLSLTLRSSRGARAVAAGATPEVGKTKVIKAVWAGDVSPALGGAMPDKPVTVERPPIDVIHGTRVERVNAPWQPDSGRSGQGGGATDGRAPANADDGRR